MNANELLRMQYEKSVLRTRKAVEGLSDAELKARPQNLAPALWQVGHLAASDASLLRRSGKPLELPAWVQDSYAKDTTGEKLDQSAEAVWAEFSKVQAGILDLIGTDLDKAIEHPAKIYGTVGEGLLYMLIHRGYHHGKIMTLRALMGKK